MLNGVPSGLEATDKVECLPKKPKGETNSKKKLNHEGSLSNRLNLVSNRQALALYDSSLGLRVGRRFA